MNGGTFSKATNIPFTRPGTAAIATATNDPSNTAGKKAHFGRRPVDHMRRDHRRQPHDEPHRQVNPAGNNHKRLPGRQQQRRNGKHGNRLNIEGVEHKGAAKI
jgi:hypothetical protein